MASLSFAILLVFLIGVYTQDMVCPNGSVASIDKSTCYSLVRSNKTFIEAEVFCGSMSGHLCSFHNGFDNLIANDYARTFLGVNATFYIGANDLLQSNQWQWTDNSTFDYNNFEWNGGSTPANSDCAEVKTDQGMWQKVNCYDGTNFCCTVPLVPAGLTTPST